MMMRSSVIQFFGIVALAHAIGSIDPYLGPRNEGSHAGRQKGETVGEIMIQIFQDKRIARQHFGSTLGLYAAFQADWNVHVGGIVDELRAMLG